MPCWGKGGESGPCSVELWWHPVSPCRQLNTAPLHSLAGKGINIHCQRTSQQTNMLPYKVIVFTSCSAVTLSLSTLISSCSITTIVRSVWIQDSLLGWVVPRIGKNSSIFRVESNRATLPAHQGMAVVNTEHFSRWNPFTWFHIKI